MTVPTSWLPVHRPSDDELVGYLLPAADDRRDRTTAEGDQVREWVPATLFGHPVGPAADEDAGRELLHATGLAVLADRWVLLRGEGVDGPTTVEIASARPDRVVVQTPYHAVSSGHGSRWQLPVPTDGALVRPHEVRA
ncbi:hypothetical protein [Puerhibacterium sp. TATVAM-FAB25]|uniref:hypothetical protein n=1 Tax=Puerhibacterium sp. TATVAM-FAB25 TaxID=3093699 RepID=UPI00397AB124